MAFKGRFLYDSHVAARLAVQSFARSACIEESVVLLQDLIVQDKTVSLDVDASAPASWWESTCEALSALSEEARGGSVAAVFDGGEGADSVYRLRVLPGGGEEEQEAT